MKKNWPQKGSYRKNMTGTGMEEGVLKKKRQNVDSLVNPYYNSTMKLSKRALGSRRL